MASFNNKMSPLLQILYQLASIANNSVDLIANLDYFAPSACIVDANQSDYATAAESSYSRQLYHTNSDDDGTLSDTDEEDEAEEAEANSPPDHTFQLHREFRLLNQRLKRTLYCPELPDTVLNSPACSWSLTEHVLDVIDRLTSSCGTTDTSSTGEVCFPTFLYTQQFHPCAIIQALVYCDRYRNLCRQGDAIYTPRLDIIRDGNDAFLAALMVASKMLHDSGEEGDVYNKLWADETNRTNSALNKLEIHFSAALQWDLNVTDQEFFAQLLQIEAELAWKRQQKLSDVPSFTYSELITLKDWLNACDTGAIRAMVEQVVKTIAVCTSAYVASIMVATTLTAAVLSSGSNSTSSTVAVSKNVIFMPPQDAIMSSYSSNSSDNNIIVLPNIYDSCQVAGVFGSTMFADDKVQQRRRTVELIRLALRRQYLLQHDHVDSYYYDESSWPTVDRRNKSVYYELAAPRWTTSSAVTSSSGGVGGYYYGSTWMAPSNKTLLSVV